MRTSMNLNTGTTMAMATTIMTIMAMTMATIRMNPGIKP